VEHAALPPQVHMPVAEEHPSAVLPQGSHCSPALPHEVAVGGFVQTLLLQQPPAQEVGVQMQVLFSQTWPAAHAAPAPQRHPPAGEQLSALPVAHVRQALPSVWQFCVDVGVTHAPRLQQPVGHDAELQTQWPLTHC
jgi:hypothetical protein